MTGLDRLEWTSIVPFVFWWLYPLSSFAIFEGFAYMMKQRDQRKMMSNKSRGKPYTRPRMSGFSIYRHLRTTVIPKPPAITFMIVWVILYILIGISSWLYANWAKDERPIFDAQFGLLWVNFVANVLWVPLFFIFTRPVLAYIDIWIVLLTALAAAALRFYDAISGIGNVPVVYVSAGLFVLYPLWVIYATLLSTDILYTMWGEDYSKLGHVKKRKIQK